jgi:ketosteroid isomerase-like protein
MSQENVEAFKRGLEAGNRGDVDGLPDELHPEIEWHSALHALMGGQRTVFRGDDGMRRPIGDLYETFAEVHIEMSEFRDLGDGGCRSSARAKRNSERRRSVRPHPGGRGHSR